MTSLINEKYRDLINDKYANQQNTVFEVILKEEAPIKEGFYIRELGLFDQDGDLIVITDVPVQYRPSKNNKNIVTELLFNIYIQIHNSDVVEIKVNEQLFSTVKQVNRLEEKIDKKLIKETNNLLDISRSFYKMFLGVGMTKVLGNKWGGTKDVNFYIPDAKNRVIRTPGNDMPWGYQEDAIQKIHGSIDCVTFVNISKTTEVRTTGMVKEKIVNSHKTATHNRSMDWWKESYVSFDSSLVARTADENRVKSLSGKIFMITKVLI